jgi:threonine aldolase
MAFGLGDSCCQSGTWGVGSRQENRPGRNSLQKQAALFFPSGTQSNLVATLAHCERGEEIIIGRNYHIYSHEAQGASVLGGVAFWPINTNEQGSLSVDDVEKSIKPDDNHYPVSKLLCLENTVSGHVQSLEQISALSDLAKENGLNVHMDGARIFNAFVHSQVPVSELTQSCDSVSICLSKGLGAPVGSLLLGEQTLINKAKRLRKMLGGGMRQSGLLAACGLYALQHNIKRLEQDHQHAKQLAQGLAEIPELKVNYATNQTNMVFLDCPEAYRTALQELLRSRGILMDSLSEKTRIVCHLDISDENVKQTIDAFKSFFTGHK